MVDLIATESDDPEFVEFVSRVLQGTIRFYKPRQVYVVHIDTWFDHKWNSYAGRIGYCCNVWLDPLRPPPFSANRVQSETAYARSEAEPFVFDRTKAPQLHIWKSGPQNSHRRLKDITPEGLYLWYSGNTKKVDRGSLMVYSVQGDLNLGWYASLLRRGEWRIGQTDGISTSELDYFAANKDSSTGTASS
jgi:hypothetical protein